MPKRIDPARLVGIVGLYKAGKTMPEIAAEVGVSLSTVRKLLLRDGIVVLRRQVTPIPVRQRTPQEIDEARRRFLAKTRPMQAVAR